MNNLDRFKFRMYNKYTKEMCYNDTTFKAEDGREDVLTMAITFSGDLFAIDLDDNFDNTFISNDELKKNKEETWVLMQCTGLKDKNGNLIYEGDVIKTSFVNCETGEPEEDDGNFSQIHFRDCCFCIVQNVGTKDEYAEHLFNKWGEKWDGSCYEVISNIYEN